MSTERSAIPIGITRLTAADAAAFSDLRLEGLRKHPEAFGASWEDEAAHSEAQWAARLESSVVLGKHARGGLRLDGVVGLRQQPGAKTRHKAILWGLYVRPGARRSGLGAALIDATITHAIAMVEEIYLTVGASNRAAYRLYHGAGFRQYGLEQRALKVEDRYYDEVLMSLVLRRI